MFLSCQIVAMPENDSRTKRHPHLTHGSGFSKVLIIQLIAVIVEPTDDELGIRLGSGIGVERLSSGADQSLCDKLASHRTAQVICRNQLNLKNFTGLSTFLTNSQGMPQRYKKP